MTCKGLNCSSPVVIISSLENCLCCLQIDLLLFAFAFSEY